MTAGGGTTSVAEARATAQRRVERLASRPPAPVLAVCALTFAALALRWPTIAGGSYWFDEWLTKRIVEQHSFIEMLKSVKRTESTPPLYYVLGWGWARVFRPDEFALRSLSGVFGAATVPVAYASGVALASRRIGIIAAAFVATNPLLVWYSTEARPYALFVLLGALTVLFVVRSLRRPATRDLALWSVTGSLALMTHYFAVFLVAAEALVLLAQMPSRRGRVALALAPMIATGVALLPLAYWQRSLTAWIPGLPFGPRVAEIPRNFVAGLTPVSPWLELAAGALALTGLLLLARADYGERRAAVTAVTVGAVTVVLPVILAVRHDYVVTRNVLPALVPFALAVAVGCGVRGARRAGLLVAACLCALWIGAVAAIAFDERLQRADWKSAATLLGPTKRERAVVAWGLYQPLPLGDDVSGMRRLGSGDAVRVSELDVLGFDRPHGISCWSGSACNMVDAHPRPDIAPSGFSYAGKQRKSLFEVLRFRAQRPVRVTWRALADIDPRYGGATVFVQTPARVG